MSDSFFNILEELTFLSFASYLEEEEDATEIYSTDPPMRVAAKKKGLRRYLTEGLESGKSVYDLLQMIVVEQRDAEFFFAQTPDKRTVVMSCRGTESHEDMFADLDFAKTRFEPFSEKGNHAGTFAFLDCCRCDNQGVPMVHLGFYKYFLYMREYIEKYMVPQVADPNVQNLVFCGHSMGGALATLCLAYFFLSVRNKNLLEKRKNAPLNVTLFTVGGARVGDKKFCDMIESFSEVYNAGQRSFNIYRVVNHIDVVPDVPFRSFGYQHLGPAYRILCDCNEVRVELPEGDDDEINAESDTKTRDMLFSKPGSKVEDANTSIPVTLSVSESVDEKKWTLKESVDAHMPGAYMKRSIELLEDHQRSLTRSPRKNRN